MALEDAEYSVIASDGIADLGGAQHVTSLRAESAGLADSRDKRRLRVAAAEAAERNRILDAEQIADAGMDHVCPRVGGDNAIVTGRRKSPSAPAECRAGVVSPRAPPLRRDYAALALAL